MDPEQPKRVAPEIETLLFFSLLHREFRLEEGR
jgi:hypothetical protein